MKTLAIAFALLISSAAHAGRNNPTSIDETYVLVCKNAKGVYFIRPTGIAYALQGLRGGPNCISAADTTGEVHLLCQSVDTPDVCDVAEAGPTV